VTFGWTNLKSQKVKEDPAGKENKLSLSAGRQINSVCRYMDCLELKAAKEITPPMWRRSKDICEAQKALKI
jgi:hypothetical protein